MKMFALRCRNMERYTRYRIGRMDVYGIRSNNCCEQAIQPVSGQTHPQDRI